MYCSNCGNLVQNGNSFCPNCGKQMDVNQNQNVNVGLVGSTIQNADSQNNMQNNSVPNSNIQNHGTNYMQSVNNNPNQYSQNNVVNNNMSMNPNNMSANPNNINRDALIDAYIGKNSNKLRDGGFSSATFIFGMYYLVYRKMYLYVLIWFVAIFTLEFVLPDLLSAIGFAGNIALCMFFNKLYVKHVEDQVDNIIYNNPGKTQFELCDICQKKGGTSIIAVIITVVIYAAINIYL